MVWQIFQPVTIEPEQYIKGEGLVDEEGQTGNLLDFARPGGIVDGERRIIRDNGLHYLTFAEGQRVVVFLEPWAHRDEVPTENLPQWAVITRYLIEDGQVQVLDTPMPLPEFLETVRQIESQNGNNDSPLSPPG
jgi:hypothetical protein